MSIEQRIAKLKKIIAKQIYQKDFEIAMVAARTLASVNYNYNQVYTDIELEAALLKIQDAVLQKHVYETDENCVFFYDGFGEDLRGWAAAYVRALTKTGSYVVYMCPQSRKDKIPHIRAELKTDNSSVVFFDDGSRLINRSKVIDDVFKFYKPKTAFFYTTPNDVSASIAFSNNASTVRFQVDLTDHAYWIGINAFDYIIEARAMGASIAHFERHISKNKIVKLDCSPYIAYDSCDVALPFDINNEKYVFTGGGIYKTLGDKNLLYYKTIETILQEFNDIKFLYAGNGDDCEMQKLITQYPKRAFLIDERPDFYELIRHCLLYINTYPMFGGLMMRYAALAGKIPITLKHNNDADGILINQKNLGVEYDNYNEYITEIRQLISNSEYRKQREDNLAGAVITEEDFKRNLHKLITEYKTEYSFECITSFDTTEFRQEYKRRYSEARLCRDLLTKDSISLFRFFPIEFLCGAIMIIKERVFK